MTAEEHIEIVNGAKVWYSTDGKVRVQCLECTDGVPRFLSLQVHLNSKHMMTLDAYRLKYGDDIPTGYKITAEVVKAAQERRGQAPSHPSDNAPVINKKPQDTVEYMLSQLNGWERQFFEERFSLLFKQADFDAALVPDIRSVVMMEVNIMRYQAEINRYSSKIQGKDTGGYLGLIEKLQKTCQAVQSQKTDLMNKLNLTREKKQQLKKSPETTPSRMVTRWSKIIAEMTPDELDKEYEDELEATKRLHANIYKMFDMLPQEASSPRDSEAEGE